MSETVKIAMLEQRLQEADSIGREFQSRVLQALCALRVMIEEDEFDEALILIDELTGK